MLFIGQLLGSRQTSWRARRPIIPEEAARVRRRRRRYIRQLIPLEPRERASVHDGHHGGGIDM